MLKKLASLLFEEEEIEEPAPKPTKKKVVEPIEEPISVPLTPERSFEAIVADDPQPSREIISEEPVQREPLFVDAPRSVTPKATPSTAPYEFRPLISPIFGVSEHEQTHRPTFAATAEVQNDSHLQTVISPYYGAIHKDPKTKTEQMPDSVLRPVVESEPKTTPDPEPIIENLALEALLEPDPVSNPEPVEDLEDHEQFSLFGDEQ